MCDIICEYFNGYISEKGEEAKLSFTPRMYIDAAEKREQERHEWEREDRENRAVETRSYPKINGKATAVKSADELAIFWRTKEAERKSYSDDLKKPLKKFLNELEKEILSNTDNVKSFNQKNLSGLFDLDFWFKRIAELTSPTIANIVIDTIDNIDGSGGEDYTRDEEVVVEETIENMETPVATIDKELKAEIEAVLRESPENVRARLDKVVKDRFDTVYTKSRLDTIADTTSHNVQQSTTRKVHKRKGWKSQWLTERDDKVRPSHEELDGTIIESDGAFDVNGALALYPGNTGEASEDINCRCVLKAVR
jgi:uncharacterized protein with gpF-like domain